MHYSHEEDPDDLEHPPGITVEQRVLVQLADLLVGTGEVLELLKGDDAAALRWIAPHVRRIHEAIDDAMSQLTH